MKTEQVETWTTDLGPDMCLRTWVKKNDYDLLLKLVEVYEESLTDIRRIASLQNQHIDFARMANDGLEAGREIVDGRT